MSTFISDYSEPQPSPNLVNIVPVEKPQTPIIETAVRVIVTSVDLGISANIDAQILNASGVIVEVKSLKLEQPDYSLWGTDDEFVVNWTLQQLGFEKSNTTV
jgi:hypothetical protein